MKRNAALAAGTIGMLMVSGVALAQTGTAAPTTATTPAQPMVLEVGSQGHVLLRGTVDSVTANSLTVKGWGGTWTVNVPSSASVMPKGVALSSFQQGDFVGVQGTIDQSASWTITATLVRDWTERKAMNQQIKQNVQAVKEEIRSGTPRNLEGTLSGLSGQSFTLTTANNATFSVTLASGAKVLQKNWLTLDFSKVQNGDTVRVWGPVSSSTVSASIFRDLSIPK